MESKHTPGPWNARHLESSEATVSGAGIPLIARVPMMFVSISQMEANAHLIAAAPDMYEALRLAVKALKGEAPIGTATAAYHNAVAALAKAEGR